MFSAKKSTKPKENQCFWSENQRNQRKTNDFQLFWYFKKIKNLKYTGLLSLPGWSGTEGPLYSFWRISLMALPLRIHFDEFLLWRSLLYSF